MANISELLKHPILLAIIPATIGLAGTLYTATKDKPVDKKIIAEQSVTKNSAEQTEVETLSPDEVAAQEKMEALEIEKTFWASIQPPHDSESSYCAYLTKYPQGNFIELAQEHCSPETLLDWQVKKKKEQAEAAAEKAEAAAQ